MGKKMPTKLKKIKIEGFRGARFPLELDFTKNAKSTGIYGDNGGGKSTITDGIEWFYTDRVDHVWKEDCKQECLRNTRFPDDKDAVVKMEFSDDKISSDKSISSSFKSKFSNTSQDFKDYLAQSGKERLFLRYGDILRFILLTKGKKRTEMMNIIGYNAVVDVRNTLVTACNDIQRDSRYLQVKGQITKNEADLMQHFNQLITEENELYEVANELVEPLNIGIQVADKQSFKQSMEKIQTTSDKEKLKRSTKLSDFKKALEDMKNQMDKTEDYDEFLKAYSGILKDKEKIKKIGLGELLEKGQKAIEDQITGENTCPLCLSEIDASNVLQQVAERIQELEEISKEVDETNTKKGSALANLRNIKSAVAEAERKKLDDDPDFQTIIGIVKELNQAMDETIKDTEQKFQKMEILQKDPDMFEKKFDAAKKEIDELLPKIQEKIDALAETDAQKRQYEAYGKLRDLERIFEENKTLSRELEIFEKQIETLTKIKDDFIQIQATVLQDALDAISGDVDTFYNMINPEEGVENIKLKLIGEEGVEVQYDFHGKQEHPPLKYLSESHLNCLGICLFLASVKLFNKENKFFILDDVITSFDSDHRIPFLRLLQERFLDYQVVLLTHEKFWYELINAEMRQFGWLFNDVSWSIEDGIELQQSVVSVKDRIGYKLSLGILDVGNDLRKLLEQILKEVCCNLEVKVSFKFNDENERRMVGELLSELRARLNKQKCDIKDHPVLKRLATSSRLTAHTSHDSPPFESKGDIQQVQKDIEEFESLFLCQNCGKYVSLQYKDEPGKKVKCRCGDKELEWAFA